MKIVERAMNNCYLGHVTVHPSDHLLFIHELCELFKCAGISKSQVKRKLFSLSLKGKAAEWYKMLKNGRPIGCSILLVRFIKIGIIFIIFILMIAQAWGSLKSLMLKCPIHELPRNIVINNFYARLLGHYKDYLDACLEGSFTSKEVEAKWDLLKQFNKIPKIGITTKVKDQV
jgi:hypothetical protein